MLRTPVTFRSAAFDTTEAKTYFINDENYGDDVAAWMAEQLRTRGIEVDQDIGQEDHGWYLTFRVEGTAYNFVVGHRDGSRVEWIGWLERSVGLLGLWFGARTRGISAEAALEIHHALSEADEVTDVEWYDEREFMRGSEEGGAPTPLMV